MRIVTLRRLIGAYRDVRREMRDVGIWTPAMHAVEVNLVPIGVALGWKWQGLHGHIDIPAVSVYRLAQAFVDLGSYRSLRHVLRHEFGHALADSHRSALVRHGAFRRTFGGSYDNRSRPYAQWPCELFADAFAIYLRGGGYRTRHPEAKAICGDVWRFMEQFITRIHDTGR